MENDQRLSQFINVENICYSSYNIFNIELLIDQFYSSLMENFQLQHCHWSLSDVVLAGKKRNWLSEIPILYFIIWSTQLGQARHYHGTLDYQAFLSLSLLLAQKLPFNLNIKPPVD